MPYELIMKAEQRLQSNQSWWKWKHQSIICSPQVWNPEDSENWKLLFITHSMAKPDLRPFTVSVIPPPTKWMKEKKQEEAQVSNISNNSNKRLNWVEQRITAIRELLEQLYANTFGNLDKMHNFLEIIHWWNWLMKNRKTE